MSGYFDDNKAKENHGRDSLRSGAVSLAASAVNAIVQVGSVMFLARLLSPEDYGLVSMVTAITGLAPLLIDLGTRDAVGQRDHITPGEISALFWTTVVMGSVFALLTGASGPLIARFYGEPRLTTIALLSSLTIIASALTYQHHALMRRAMKFKELALIEVAANVVGTGVAITIALDGGEYWALVTRPIATNFLVGVGVWSYCRWLPGKPTITPGVKEMLRFGIHTIAFSGTDFVGRNCDRVVIGLAQGARSLGFFQNALLVYGSLLDLLTPLNGVALVSLSKLRDDMEKLRSSWAKALSFVTFYVMPAYGLLAVIGQDLIVLLLGNKWSQAGILLSVLALRGPAHAVERTHGWLHVAAGRADRLMRWGVIGTSVQVVALFSGLPFGTMGVVSAYVLCMYVLFVPAITYAGRPLGIGATDVINAVGRQLVGALGSAGLGFVLRHTLLADSQRLARTVVLVATYIASYLLVVVGLFRVIAPLRAAVSLLPSFLTGRFAALGKLSSMRGRNGG